MIRLEHTCRAIARAFLLSAVLAATAFAHPLSNPQPASNVLAPGRSSVDLTVHSSAAATCGYSVGTDRPIAQMTPFSQGAGTSTHRTIVPIDPDPRVVNDVFVRCSVQPESVLHLRYRSRAAANPSFPRIGNLWGWGRWKYAEGRTLAERARVDLWMGADLYDVGELASYQSDFFQLRTLNPDILLLASMNAVEPYTSAIPESYYLHDVHGQRIEVWPGSWRLNLTHNEVADFQAQWAYARIAEAGFIHDGVFVDNVFLSQSWQDHDIYGNPVQIDADGNGIADDPAALDAAWRAGVLREVEAIRALMPDILMSGHALDSSEPRILAAFNGISFGFEPANVIEREQEFGEVAQHQQTWATQARSPRLNMHEGSPIDLFAYGYDYDPLSKARTPSIAFARDYYPWMRFALGLALLQDGYYAYEWGDTDHGQSWWYDEYDFALGSPLGPAVNTAAMGFDPGPNRIDNPGFESAIVAPWGSWADNASGYAATFVRDAAVAHGGAASARIDVTQAGGEAWRIEFRQDARTVVAGTSYELTFWAKASGARTIDVATTQNAPPWAAYGLYGHASLGTDWQLVTLPFTATASGGDVRLQFLLGAATGSVWIDDVRLVLRAPDVMRRDFGNGVVLLNGTPDAQTIAMGPGFRRLAGAQAPRVQAILDDSSATFTTPAGAWTRRALDSGEWKAAGPFFHSFGDSLHWLAAGAGEARWSMSVPRADDYTLSVWIPAAPESATWTAAAHYELLRNGVVAATRTLSQRSGGDTWQAIGTATLGAGDHVELRLTCAAGPCVADAVYLESAGRYNDGTAANSVTLQPFDAILLARDATAGTDPPGGDALRFSPVAPNPVRASASFGFDLPAAGPVTLRVFDAAGRLVATPAHGLRPAGPAALTWNLRGRSGRRVPPGVYLAELRLGDRSARRMFVVAP